MTYSTGHNTEKLIYFDNAATTPMDSRVIQAMEDCQKLSFGNPSSLHRAGRLARDLITKARHQLALLLDCKDDEVIFTGSGTEANNLALIGVARAAGLNGVHIITSAIEHPAVTETCRFLETQGAQISFLPVTQGGLVEPSALKTAFRDNTRLVSVMTANNVVGTLQPISELAKISHEHGALFHTDAVQAIGKIPLSMKSMSIDLLSASAHKLYGPKGMGALYIRRGVTLKPLIHGGGQERGLRSATENVAGIVGFGVAAEIASTEYSTDAAKSVRFREKIITSLMESIPNAYVIGDRYRRLPGHICFGLADQEGDGIKLLLQLDRAGIAVSSGSACSSNHGNGPSRVLMEMGMNAFQAQGSLRISLGRFNTESEVDQFVSLLPEISRSLNQISTLSYAAKDSMWQASKEIGNQES